MTMNCTNRNWSHRRVRGTEALSVNDAKRKVNINRENTKEKMTGQVDLRNLFIGATTKGSSCKLFYSSM